MNSKRRKHESGTESILRIHRLFDDPLPADAQICPWYCPPGGMVDCNALLDITGDREFIEAAVWQIHGHETAGRQRQRWLKRLGRSSRTSLIMGMRYKSAGRRRAVKIPGLWIALLLDPPGQQFLGTGFLGTGFLGIGRLRRSLHWLRHQLVAWRYRGFTHANVTRSEDQSGQSDDHHNWRRAS
jgi:hypothetical protein